MVSRNRVAECIHRPHRKCRLFTGNGGCAVISRHAAQTDQFSAVWLRVVTVALTVALLAISPSVTVRITNCGEPVCPSVHDVASFAGTIGRAIERRYTTANRNKLMVESEMAFRIDSPTGNRTESANACPNCPETLCWKR